MARVRPEEDGGKSRWTTTPSGAQFEISVDGIPRSYRDMKVAATAAAAAEFLKRRKPEQ
jgi:hypothetical protein